MSAEVAKKRGRPKKVITEPVEVDVPKNAKTTTRAKSTKAAPKTSKASKATPKTPAKPATTRKTASKPIPQPEPEPEPSNPAPAKTPTPKITPESSKILHTLRQQTADPPPQSSAANPLPPPASKIPLAAMNRQIVGDVSAGAGARRLNPGAGRALPKNYKSVATKIRLTIVALPIALVTSWILYERLVLGKERLSLKPKTPPDEASTPS